MSIQKIILSLFFACICQISMATPDNIKSVVSGRIANVPEGYYLYLSDPVHNILIKSPIEKGSFQLVLNAPRFSFKGTLTMAELFFAHEPNLNRLQLLKGKTRGPTIILEENVEITGDLKSNQFQLHGRYNDQLEMFSILDKEVKAEADLKLSSIKTAKYSPDEKGKREFSVRSYSDFQLKLKRLELIGRLRDKVALDQLLFQANNIFYGFEAAEKTFNLFSDSLRQSETGKIIAASIEKRKGIEKGFLQIGDPFPGLSLPDQTGKITNLADRKPGLYLIDIWASWCGPCRAEIPYIQDAQKNFSQLKVIAISIDESQVKWRSAIAADGSKSFQHFLDDKGWKSATVKKLAIIEIPQNFLVNEKGIIVARNIRNEEIVAIVSGVVSN